MDGTTEASDVAHFGAFWAATAVMLGREIQMWSGRYVFPNIYILFFGASGDKKTTAQRRVVDCQLLDRDPNIPIIRSAGSTEGLADMLMSHPGKPYLFAWEEFSGVQAIAGWGGSTLQEFIVETYDCPPDFRRAFRKNKIEIDCPTPSILTATVPEAFWRNATPDDFYTGFGNRFVYLTGNPKGTISDPAQIDGEGIALIKRCLAQRFDALAQNPRRRGHWTAQAQQRWQSFYNKFSARQQTGLLDAALKRIHVHVRKLAMVYAFLEGTFPEIVDEQLHAAISVNLYAAHCAKQLLDMRVSNPASQDRREMETRIMHYLRSHGGSVPLRKLHQRICQHTGDSESFSRVMRSLRETDQISDKQDGRRKIIQLS
jgi:hypothetical protein